MGQRVLLVTEGTYPFSWGGLSTWCHSLVRELDEIEFSVLAVTDAPGLQSRFELPDNVVDFRPVPLWRIRNAWEADDSRGFREVLARRRRVRERAVEEEFLPPFRTFLAHVLGEDREAALLVGALHGMYSFFLEHDFDRALRSRPAWEVVVEESGRLFRRLGEEHDVPAAAPTANEVLTAWQWIYHWLFALARPLPQVDVAHATMAGICSLVCAVTKAEHGCRFVLSEHGIYLRESYLAEHASSGSRFLKLLKLRFARSMTALAYAEADVVAPCCDYNQRWERQFGAPPERIRTAYYGIDANAFKLAARSRRTRSRPVVAWAGRIDPLKDLETLLRAAVLVLTRRPEVRFRLYGSAAAENEGYLARCLALHRSLRLGGGVTFEGYAESTSAAFADADLVVLSSISEGFPYSTLEAMLCGKPVVATGVGGIREQVSAGCGRIVRPRDPQALGEAILDVLGDRKAAGLLARAARDRVASLFTIERFRSTHRDLYTGAADGEVAEHAVLARGGRIEARPDVPVGG